MKKAFGVLAVCVLGLSLSFAQNGGTANSSDANRGNAVTGNRDYDSGQRDHNWGWIGLLGLAGLGGLRGRRDVGDHNRNVAR